MKSIKVLMTGAGAPGAPGIISSLRNNNERDITIIGVDMNSRASGFSMVDKGYIVPKASDKNFIDEIMRICKSENVDVVLPLVTKELFKFAESKQCFENEGVKVSISDNESLQIANDKGKLIDFMAEKGLSIPLYRVVKSVKEFKQATKDLGYPQRPVCFKPTVSNGSRGFRVIDPKIDKSYLLFNTKPNSTYITYDEIIDILDAMEEMPELIVMEYLPGEEYSIDILAKKGESIYVIPRRRDRMVGGISVAGTVVNDEEIIQYCKDIIKILNSSGNIGIQVKRNIEGKPMILEINPRVQGTIVLCTGAGVNMPYYGIKLALGEEIPKVDIKWNTQMIRYWNEVYYDSDGHAFTL